MTDAEQHFTTRADGIPKEEQIVLGIDGELEFEIESDVRTGHVGGVAVIPS